MADAITIKALQDASLDAKSLEEVVNGNETKQVTTRKGETYPSVKKAIDTMFQNGGLPATPFTTKALMTASALINGKYAFVTDDANISANGLYLKQGGAWVMSKYAPKSIIDTALSAMYRDFFGDVTLSQEIIKGRHVATPYHYGVTNPLSNYSYVRYDVSGVKEVTVTGADTTRVGLQDGIITWAWMAVDEDIDIRLKVYDNNVNTTLVIPDGAKWLIKTSISITHGINDTESLELKALLRKPRSMLELETYIEETKVSALREEAEVVIAPIDGNLINVNRNSTALLTGGVGMQYIAIDVTDVDKLIVSGENEGVRIAETEWVFSNHLDTRGDRVAFANFSGNGELRIPDGVKYAVRNYSFIGSSNTAPFHASENLSIKTVGYFPTRRDMEKLQHLVRAQNDEVEYEYARKIIAESGLTLYKLSDFAGKDSHEKIDEAIKFIKLAGNGGILDLESGLHKRRSAVLLPDNFWLYINDSTIMLEDGVHDNLFRNEGIVPNPDPFGFALELNENKNIRIFGNGAHRSHVRGPDKRFTAPHPVLGGEPVPWESVYFGWRTLEFNFVNTKNLRLHGYSLTGSRCWGHLLSHGCHDFKIHDLHIESHSVNGDGIDVLFGCKNGEIYNISGNTEDDLVALSPINNWMHDMPKPNNKKYAYPMLIGTWRDAGFGLTVEDVNIYNIHGGGNYCGVRLLTSGDGKIRNVNISDVYADFGNDFRISSVVIGTGYGVFSKMGALDNITVNNVKAVYAREALQLHGPMQNMWFNNIDPGSESATLKRESTETQVYGDNVKFTRVRGKTVEVWA